MTTIGRIIASASGEVRDADGNLLNQEVEQLEVEQPEVEQPEPDDIDDDEDGKGLD